MGSGKTQVCTYNFNELLGTKLRALYQRSKGQDLFDLDYGRHNLELNIDQIIEGFNKYIESAIGNRPPSQKKFLLNTEEKEKDADFTVDMEAILRSGITYDQNVAFEWSKSEFVGNK